MAIKKLIKYDKNDFENEKFILNRMNNCEYSVKYIESFEEKNNMFIITELCDCDLRDELKENGFSIYEIKQIFYQINNGLKYLLKEVNVIHRDIKPDNILINKIIKNDKIYYQCKLCDYGQSKDINKSSFSSLVGTKNYTPKEVLNRKYTIKSDIFVLGLILYEYIMEKKYQILMKMIN